MSNLGSILIIDSDFNSAQLLKNDLERVGYKVSTASNGSQGWQFLHQQKTVVNAIILERIMPDIDGLQFMARLKGNNRLANIPVIMLTASTDSHDIIEGIRAGVYYYQTKPYDTKIMMSIVYAALADYNIKHKIQNELMLYRSKLKLLRSSSFVIQTIEDANYLATFLANFYPQPERAAFGILELLINAIEHGNLEIGYQEKTELNNEGIWADEIERRLQLDVNKNKIVEVDFTKQKNAIILTITDEGKGFAWAQYLEISVERALDNHGRGIALSKMMSFDTIEYKGVGNQVVCTVYLN